MAVASAFWTNSKGATELQVGQQGVVRRIDDRGDALIDFDHLPLAEWIFNRNLGKLCIIEAAAADDEPVACGGCIPFAAWHRRRTLRPPGGGRVRRFRLHRRAASTGALAEASGPGADDAIFGGMAGIVASSGPMQEPSPVACMASPVVRISPRGRPSLEPPEMMHARDSCSPLPCAGSSPWTPDTLRPASMCQSPAGAASAALARGSPTTPRRGLRSPRFSPFSLLSRRSSPGDYSESVRLNIYDLGKTTPVQWANGVLLQMGTGVFHAGVEVYGKEYSFGHRSDRSSGVVWCPPRQADGHKFREAIELGTVHMSNTQVLWNVGELAEEWPGREYDLLRRNCCHFCDAFCKRLGVNTVPDYVFSMAEAGARIRDQLETAVTSVGTAAHSARNRLERGLSWDPIEVAGRDFWVGAVEAARRFMAPQLIEPVAKPKDGAPGETESARDAAFVTPRKPRRDSMISPRLLVRSSPTPARNLAADLFAAMSPRSSRVTRL